MNGFIPQASAITFTVLLFFILGCAATSKMADELLELEKQRYQAMVETDLTLLDSMLDDDLIFTHASSMLDTKESFLKNLRSGRLNYKAIDIEDVEVRMHEGCGIVTGKSLLDIHSRGEDRKLQLRFTTVWLETSAGWKVVAYQSTRADSVDR
jgi:ketosteroid isomerase-like protein